ncbi:MAG TPA: tRNA guanosine(34) transglycosylase Tgt [Candidatus Acidoferrales bacterium]|nr:tRNA guanosine(34) transglycosylase Tgt [Candidatus Acidoferrales bacterium]
MVPHRFTISARDGKARRGTLRTAHGEVQTPAFMPVGTHATVKACDPTEVAESGAEMLLANFYHLSLRPGVELVAEMGGLHRFMNWQGSILTDSGGYQLVSLGELVQLDDRGVTFRSPYDGDSIQLTPKGVVEGQLKLGSDVIMVLDHPVPFGTSPALAAIATRRTHLWAEQCRQIDTGESLLFGIVQGGFEVGPRAESAAAIAGLGFDGVALGGLVLGEPPQVRQPAIDACVEQLPEQLPRYVMGLGTDLDLLDSVARGVDLFDCVLPTRLARTGTVLTDRGRLSLRQARFRRDGGPLEEGCQCPACGGFSRAYLRHLYVAGEILAHRLLSLHNLWHLSRLMTEARQAIESGQLQPFIAGRCQQVGAGIET